MLSKKAANLITLKEKGINVPDFVVVTYDEIMAAGGPGKYRFSNPFLDRLSEGTFAVRSACSLEDSADASFAGQFDTYLNVGRNEIDTMIGKCLESLDKSGVKEYMERRRIRGSGIKMDIIVQRMVDADYAGVIFTANPQGILNESVIAVARGLGEGVVADRADSVTYYYNKTDKVYYYQGEEELLTKENVTELMDIAGRICDIFGEYQDIEFAIKDDEIFILQTRDITTIDASSPLIMDNSNIVESYPGLSLPLTESFVDVIYTGVFRGVCRRILKDDSELSKFENNFHNMVGHVNGRVYYKISNWYALLKCLPFGSFIIPIWQEMLGVRNKSYDRKGVRQSPLVRGRIYLNTFHELKSVPAQMKALETQFERINSAFYSKDIDNLSLTELKALYEELREKLLDIWDITLLNDLYAFVYTGLSKKRLKRKYKKTDNEINLCISGNSEIESMKPIRAMIELAYNMDKMSPAEVETAKAAYIRDFGDRSLEELKLESRTFRSDPVLLDEKLKEYRQDPQKLEELYLDMSGSEASPEGASIEDFDRITKKLLSKCRLGIANRETSRLNRTRIFGIVRMIFLLIGKNLAKNGILREERDIFYLTIDEIWDIIDGGRERDCKALIQDRKRDYRFFETLPAYSRLIFTAGEFDKKCADVRLCGNLPGDDRLVGVPCSGGVVTGEALVITDVKGRPDVKDKILVTAMTDPGWVFFLATAKGVIARKGSLLSHTAIISRELGIPSIVGVENAMNAIHTGDIITMNGNTGEITILKDVKDVAS